MQGDRAILGQMGPRAEWAPDACLIWLRNPFSHRVF